MAFIMTRIDCGDYDTWRKAFDADTPGARKSAIGWRIYRSVDKPSEVFIQVEFASTEEAAEGRRRLLAAGVLDRFSDHSGPTVVEEAETVVR